MTSLSRHKHVALGLTIGLSLLVHGWALLRPMAINTSIGDPSATSLKISIAAPQGDASTPEAVSRREMPNIARPVATSVMEASALAASSARAIPLSPQGAVHKAISKTPLEKAISIAPTAQASAPVQQPGASDPTRERSQESTAHAMLARIKTDLARHFHYPRIARQRGWEGEVILGFVLNPDGRIDTIKITKSSGFYLLDQAACKSLQQVRQLQLADLQPGSARHLQLPVIYRLTDS